MELREDKEFWEANSKYKKKGGKPKGEFKDNDEQEEINDSDRDKDASALDMRKEDAELEKILRDYNNEQR